MTFPLPRGPYGDGPGYMNGWFITSYFGGRIDPLTGRVGVHGGMDLAYPGCSGQPIIAPEAGLLSQGWDPSGGGNWSGLTTHAGDYWGFGHANAFAFPGGGSRWVEAGTTIAYVGTTGGSTGPHLHVAWRPNGANGYRDPYDALAAAAAIAGDIINPGDEDEMTDAQMQELKDYIDARLEQVAAADRAHMATIRDQGCERLEAQDGALVRQVERVRDEALAARPG